MEAAASVFVSHELVEGHELVIPLEDEIPDSLETQKALLLAIIDNLTRMRYSFVEYLHWGHDQASRAETRNQRHPQTRLHHFGKLIKVQASTLMKLVIVSKSEINFLRE